MKNLFAWPEIPSFAWSRQIGLGWEKPYTTRHPSNLDDGPWHGMPLGGFGAGAIGRSCRGDFNLWHLDGGEHTFQSLGSCQFSIFEQVPGEQAKAYALCTQKPEDGTLSSWSWYPQGKGTYHALYPRSWYEYSDVFATSLICEQFSPILAHNYQETSYPIAIFEWTAHNPTDKPITLSIMLSWQNMVGWFTNAIKSNEIKQRDDGSPYYDYQVRWGDSIGSFNQWIQDNFRVGCLFNRIRLSDEVLEGEGQMSIASVLSPDREVFYHSRWNPSADGTELWDSFAADGTLSDYQDETPAQPGEQIAAAFCVRFTINPGTTRKIPFILAWDFPITEFAPGVNYYRRYSDFFGRTGNNAWSMVRTALKSSDLWREQIEQWQAPINNDPQLPNWLKMALFNELYLLSDGGTIWSAASENDPVGQFGVLECIDYRWYESLDVRLYGSFGLLKHWPRLDKAILEAFARAIPQENSTSRYIGYNGTYAQRKIKGATPHDLGAPNEHPWQQSNYTSYQDCNLWKDLACDFVLQVYRDFYLTGSQDTSFLWECWDSVVEALDYLKEFDLDGDGIPENSGAPDQTYDDWRLQGISAYCAGLWIAALESAKAIGQVLLKTPKIAPILSSSIEKNLQKYQNWLELSRPLYHKTLWNGQYYNLDSLSGSDVVMSDQLCGQFYLQLLGLDPLVEQTYVHSTLKTVYQSCFLNFADGKYGAANGLRLDGTAEDPSSTHPQEVWIGINFGLAAFFIQQGMKQEGLKLAQTVVKQVYENGLQFRTPEAITAVGTFRVTHYLRAMAIWAVYGSLKGWQ